MEINKGLLAVCIIIGCIVSPAIALVVVVLAIIVGILAIIGVIK